MEKTTRPTQVRTNTPLNQRTGRNGIYSQGAGETGQGGGQQGQWASDLSNGYENKLSGQEMGNGQNRQEIQTPDNRQNERMIQGRRGRRTEQGGQETMEQQDIRERTGERESRETIDRQRERGADGTEGRPGNQENRSRLGSRMYQEAMSRQDSQEAGSRGRSGQETREAARSRQGAIGGSGSPTAQNNRGQQTGGQRYGRDLGAGRGQTAGQEPQETSNQRTGWGILGGRNRTARQEPQETPNQRSWREFQERKRREAEMKASQEMTQETAGENQTKEEPKPDQEIPRENVQKAGREPQEEKGRQPGRVNRQSGQPAEQNRENQEEKGRQSGRINRQGSRQAEQSKENQEEKAKQPSRINRQNSQPAEQSRGNREEKGRQPDRTNRQGSRQAEQSKENQEEKGRQPDRTSRQAEQNKEPQEEKGRQPDRTNRQSSRQAEQSKKPQEEKGRQPGRINRQSSRQAEQKNSRQTEQRKAAASVEKVPPGSGDRRQPSRKRGQAGRTSVPPQYTSRVSSVERKSARTEQVFVEKAPPRLKRKPGAGANFLVQGSILAAAGIVVRLIGMVYRIPLAHKIGDNGNGYYNAAYSIYSILLILSSYSLPTAVSKMISAKLAKGEYRASTKIFKVAMFYATVAGMAGFCVLWFGAEYFASQIIRMPYSSYALKALAPTIWIMAYLGVLRGYFQGHSTMVPTAVSQIFEQVVNAVVSIVAASMLFDVGIKSNLVYGETEYSYAFGAAGGAIGTGAGAVTALIFFLLLALGYRPTMRKKARRDKGGKVESYKAISQALFATIIPIIISSAIYNISNVVDNSIFGNVMEELGESSLTASHWGVYMGRYHLLFNIPVAIANSLSSSLIPTLSSAAAERNRRQIHAKIGSAIRFSMLIAIPSAVGLTVLAEPVSNLLFGGMDNTMLIKMMAVGSSAVVFFSLSTVSNAILQGINRMNVPIINSAIALAIHIGVLYVMLKFFHLGIYSVVYANILFAVLVCLLNAVSIAKYTKYQQKMGKTFFIPFVASVAMGGAAWGTYQLCIKAADNRISTAAAILVAVAVYFILLILLKGVDERDFHAMPGGTRFIRVARRLHLM